MNARSSKRVLIAASVVLSAGLAGCSAPSATLDLISVARKGLSMARQAEVEHHAQLAKQVEAQLASLDSAFDADVRLAATGQVRDPDGKVLTLTADWVISARKGYAAARDILAGQTRSADASHAVRVDNLKAADDALDMAAQLTVQQWAITNNLRQELINVQRRLINGK